MNISHSGRARVTSIVVAIIVVIIVAIACFGYFYTPARNSIVEAWSVLRLPADLRDATFISYQQTGPEFWRVQGRSYLPVRTINPASYLYMHEGTTTVTAVNNLPDKLSAIFVGNMGVVQSTSTIATVSISPDGNTLAYSVATPSVTSLAHTASSTGLVAVLGVPFYTTPDGWMTKLFLMLPRKEVSVGSGYSPLFIDSTHVLLFQPNGVYVLDTATAQEKILLSQTIGTIDRPMLSPDRSLVAWTDKSNGKLLVYRVTPTSMKSIGAFTRPKGYLTLGNNALYAMRDVTLWETPLAGGTEQEVDSFPLSIDINNIAL